MTRRTKLSKFWEESIQLSGYYSYEEAVKACPKGWRLPTKKEQISLIKNTKYYFDNILKQGVFVFKDGFELRLPAAGYRSGSSGSSSNLAASGNYWSSTLIASGKSPRLYFGSSNAGTFEDDLAYCFSVRCVRDEKYELKKI